MSYELQNEILLSKGYKTDICFVGDEHISWWETSAYFRNYGNVINRGKYYETPMQTKDRFSEDVLKLSPKVIVLMCGMHTLFPLDYVYRKGIDYLWEQAEQQLQQVRKAYEQLFTVCKNSNSKLLFCAVIPTHADLTLNDNYRIEYIRKLNKIGEELCENFGFTYVDSFSPFLSKKGILNFQYSSDYLHLNAKGYRKLAEMIYPILDRFLMEERE